MKKRQTQSPQKQAGFSYIEVMIALVILLVGVLGLTSALSANLIRSYESEKRIIAKQTALSTIESMISARDIQRFGSISGWETIGNVGTNPVSGVNQGIFLTGFTPIREDLGWDGVAGTADDACAGTGNCTVNGKTNSSKIVSGFQRKIVITDIEDPDRPSPRNAIARRSIEVTIRYTINQITRDEVMSTIITNY
jgi:prepilin-type N-terminal cleavage/methylation domain-containing protein